jgi:hypothetical protein
VRGRESYLDMWRALVKSAPDFLFDLQGEPRLFYDPLSLHLIVASRFTWFGTRVRDVLYSEPEQGNEARPKAGERQGGDAAESPQSIFLSSNPTEIRMDASDFDERGKFSVSAKPLSLSQQVTMRCRGSLLLYIQTDTGQIIEEHKALLEAFSVSLSPLSTKKAVQEMKNQLQTQCQGLQDRLLRPVQLPCAGERQTESEDALGKVFKLEFVYTASDEKVL